MSSFATSFIVTALPISAATPVSYKETFENKSAVSDVTGLTVEGGNASVIKDGTNSVLKVTGGEKVTFTLPAATTKSVVEVSYKMKVVTVGSGNWNSFAAMQGDNEVAAAFRIGTQLLQYINTSGTNNNQRLFFMDTAKDSGKYVEVSYKIDFENNRVYPYVDGDGSMITAKVPVRTTGATGVNKIYFDVPTGDVLYFDDITVKEETLELKSARPADKSKNYKMDKYITMNFSAQIQSQYMTKDYFELYENDVLVSNYTIAQPTVGKITITPSEGFKGNSTYKVVVKSSVNSGVDGAIVPVDDITYQFTTNGFLVTAVNDDTYGGKVFVNGKKYKFSAKYKNDTAKTQNPVILIATSENGKLQKVELKDGYTVASGAVCDVSFEYTAKNLDETTKVSVYLWDGVDTMVPLSESTTAIGEYEDGTPAYEEKLLNELKTKYDSKNISGFNIGVITDAQPAVMNGYTSYLHHYKSLAKAAKLIKLNMLADLGDSINHSFDKSAGLALMKSQSDVLKTAGLPVMRVPGNHDDNRAVVNIKKDASYYITREEWVEACDVDWASVMDGSTAGNKPYYYKDFDDDKIRVIAIDTHVTPFTYNESDTSWKFGFSGEQLKWLAEEALDLSDKADKTGWGIVLLGHVFGGGYNNVEFQKIVQAFIDGSSGSVSGGADIAPITGTISYDYTSQGAQELICTLDGHYHMDKESTFMNKPHITINSSLPDTAEDPDRELKSDTEDTWDIVTIDRTNKKIYCTRFGSGKDREFSY